MWCAVSAIFIYTMIISMLGYVRLLIDRSAIDNVLAELYVGIITETKGTFLSIIFTL